MAKGRKNKNAAPRLQTAAQAVAVAEAYEMDTLEMLAHLNGSPDLSKILAQIAPWLQDGRFTGRDKQRLIRSLGPNGHTVVNTLQEVLLDADRIFLWLQHRVVYRVYPELAESLLGTDTGTSIPCEVLRRIPHPDPFIAFPTPIPGPPPLIDRPLAKPPVYVGMLVTGLTNELTLCSTADPRLHMLTVALVGRVSFVGAGEPRYPSFGIEIPCMAQRFTIDEMIEAHLAIRSSAGDATELELSAYRLAVSLLLYICSDRRDMSGGAEVLGRRTKHHTPQAPSTVVDVGFDIGPKLFAARTHASEGSTGSGKRVRPHIRRAHWHTYWTGPRDQSTPEVRWLHPILVHPSERDASRSIVIEDGQDVQMDEGQD
ncbi:hypothetical protein H0264_18495 [Nocardia huaxiensis]|uniref:Uncharacterized protein n=1 Tax=Nocardia huaxiensis TaxID=2755382 RepID=A0A7D6VF65_9NOCA|nr:hypothetical protein [Nocardia huaxiensis]QLY33951.1 hypothetical protein H0264_18495 [Nocardia huaxiensis]